MLGAGCMGGPFSSGMLQPMLPGAGPDADGPGIPPCGRAARDIPLM